MSAIYPLQQGGAASDSIGALAPDDALTVHDLTAAPRFGIKGMGSAAWFAAQGISLPAINRHNVQHGVHLLRLGTNDIVCLSTTPNGTEIADLRRSWNDAASPKGYVSWREEGWAWLRLTGTALGGAMARLCALDLRPSSFAGDEVAQTRFAYMDAIVFRSAAGFDILFDITLTAHVLTAIEVARHAVQSRDV